MWSHRWPDLSGLVRDLHLPRYVTAVLGRTWGTISDPSLSVLLEEVLLRSDPHRLAGLPGPAGGPYAAPEGRAWRLGVVTRAADVITRGCAVSDPLRDVVLTAVGLGVLGPGCTRAGQVPVPDRVPGAIWERAHASNARLAELRPLWRDVTRVAPLAALAAGHSAPRITPPLDAPGIVRAAAWAADHGVVCRSSYDGEIPPWADPRTESTAAWPRLEVEIRWGAGWRPSRTRPKNGTAGACSRSA